MLHVAGCQGVALWLLSYSDCFYHVAMWLLGCSKCFPSSFCYILVFRGLVTCSLWSHFFFYKKIPLSLSAHICFLLISYLITCYSFVIIHGENFTLDFQSENSFKINPAPKYYQCMMKLLKVKGLLQSSMANYFTLKN